MPADRDLASEIENNTRRNHSVEIAVKHPLEMKPIFYPLNMKVEPFTELQLW